ncbi:hypothetical protein PV04_07319 [Phialophora macrospora]|uniref:CCHC-type domain-containing protein n=1 Tax=Phialophora macrospora TaxID=1851006 RepID=A0A0D2CIM0_9EURO|nr:hypothetical protein PV04_07319 [Phialophora macrospora]
MQRLAPDRDGDSESRTSAVGSNRQMRWRGQVHAAPSLSSRSSSLSSHDSVTGTGTSQPLLSTAPTRGGIMASSSGYGNNRLATGFRKMPLPQSGMREPPDPPQMAISLGASAHDAIEISDDDEDEDDEEEDEEESDGGMVINVGNSDHEDASDSMDVDEEYRAQSREGLTEAHSWARETLQSMSSTGHQAHSQLQGDSDRFLNIVSIESSGHPAAANPSPYAGPRLADLNPKELEYQLKYAFFDLDPDTIDLSQPAICLGCLQPGHAEQDCPEIVCIYCSHSHSSRLCPRLQRCSRCRDRGHAAEFCRNSPKDLTVPCDICGSLGHVEQRCSQRFFPPNRNPVGEPLKLWISCSICTSKSHLVGDCELANQAATARWSLKAVPQDSIVNLSVGADTQRMEGLAANRGLRPEGLKIRGRAGLHNARVPNSAPDSDSTDGEEQFLRPAVKIRDVPIPPNFTLNTNRPSESKGLVQAKKTAVPAKPAESQINIANIPNRAVLSQFIDQVNSSRKQEGKAEVQLVYRENGPCIIDPANPARKTRQLGNDVEQKRVIWEWVKRGKKSGRTLDPKSRAATRLGEAYLV